jgi:hypothetical protein
MNEYLNEKIEKDADAGFQKLAAMLRENKEKLEAIRR